MSTKRRNLIVNYIPSHLKEEQLYELFSSVGAIKSLRIMRNSDSSGKGYGFVEYQTHASAEIAIKQFDGLKLGKKQLKVAYARPGGSREGCNLFVKNLPCTWTTEKLNTEFGYYGELLECRVLSTNDFQSRRCGFVRFDLPRDAHAAMKGMNGQIPEDGNFQIKVSHATKRGRSSNDRSNSNNSRNQLLDDQNEPAYNSRRLPNHEVNISFQNTNYSASTPFAFPGAPGPGPVGDSVMRRGNSEFYGQPGFVAPPQQPQYDAFRAYEYGSSPSLGSQPPSEASMPVQQSYTSPQRLPNSTHRPSQTRNSAHFLHKSTEESRSSNSLFESAAESQPPSSTEPSRSPSSRFLSESAKESSPQCSKGGSHIIMLANLPTFLEELHLQHICRKYGEVSKILIQRDNNDNNLGCAEVTFVTLESKEAALKGLNGCVMCDKTIICH